MLAATLVGTSAAVAGDTLDVKTFGAKGDGVTDDTAALNRLAKRTGGKNVFFSPGTYLIGGPVVFDKLSGQSVFGSGATVKASPTYQRDNSDAMLLFTNASDLTVRDLTIVGTLDPSAVPTQVNTDGVRVIRGKNVTVSGLTVSRAPTNGITVQESDKTLVKGNTIREPGMHGLWGWKSRDQTYLDNTVVGLGQSRYGGIGLLGTIGEGFVAQGNRFSNMSDTGTKTEGVSHVVYQNNTVETFGKDGIKAMPYPGQSKSVTDVLIEDNTVRGLQPWRPDGSGYILLQSVIGGRALNNKIYGSNGQPAVYDEDAIKVNAFGDGPPSRDIAIVGNEASDTRRGIRVEAANAVVRGNTVKGRATWARSGMIVSSDGVTVADNTFDGPAVGLLLDRGVSGTRVEANTFANLEAGVYADNGNDATIIVGNRFSASVARPIVGQVGSNGTCRDNVGAACP